MFLFIIPIILLFFFNLINKWIIKVLTTNLYLFLGMNDDVGRMNKVAKPRPSKNVYYPPKKKQ